MLHKSSTKYNRRTKTTQKHKCHTKTKEQYPAVLLLFFLEKSLSFCKPSASPRSPAPIDGLMNYASFKPITAFCSSFSTFGFGVFIIFCIGRQISTLHSFSPSSTWPMLWPPQP